MIKINFYQIVLYAGMMLVMALFLLFVVYLSD